MARSAAYWNMLSGSAGYSFGVGQTFYWGPRSIDGMAGDWDWQTALDMPSSFEMIYMKNFFTSIEWWRLVPDHDLILNQPQLWVDRMVLSRTPSGDIAVAYLPDVSDIVIDMTDFPTDMEVIWFNPVTNEYVNTSTNISNTGPASQTRPIGWNDTVLLLKSVPNAVKPTITPNGGIFNELVEVSLQTTTPGATIYYTDDGSIPTTDSLQYAAPFTLIADATVSAFTVASGYNDSAVASADFTVIPVEACEGDFDHDSDVDSSDLANFTVAFDLGRIQADLNLNGVVDAGDVFVFVEDYGRVNCLY